jgi:hypothetical protein
MSADTRPISPGRFAAAIKDLSISTLHLKVLEIRNSIAHLQYSNDQLKPFAEGSATALGGANDGTDAVTREPDQDCIDAIKENEVVIDRMAERIAIIRAEVEERGVSWTEFQSKEEAAAAAAEREKEASAAAERRVNGHGQETHSAWTDGTFQTGTIRNGQVHMDNTSVPPTGRGGDTGGRLNDEELRRALEERMRDLGTDGDDDDGGMHL